ncbi:hypothetical protein SVAN01_10431 [Stagonosporopsis vannaccii]|nr:hypothetical protein SVAN01_10431 [Stagonosporopsis vannaccii]
MIRIRPSFPRLRTRIHNNGARWFTNSATHCAPRVGSKNHWTAEKLRTTTKYPLTLELLDKAHPESEEAEERRRNRGHARAKKKKTTTNRYTRPQIVSPDLCDDVLKFYGKSLEVHKGCDVLDINPGAGLWSQKLHAFLQPRSHVLMEPSPERYGSFLDPLLNAPGSRFKLVSKDTNELESYTQMLDEGVFPTQTRVDPHDNSGQELNTSLLVTGMLVWDPTLPGLGFDSMAKQLYNLFSSAVRTNDLFHAYGRVRTLFWVGADDFRPIIAESIGKFDKNNCLLELTQQMEMIVNAPRTERKVARGASGRDVHYEVESTVRAIQSARESGMALFADREDHMYKVAAEIEKISKGSGRSNLTWMHEYLLERNRKGDTTVGLLNTSTLQHLEHLLELQKKYPDVDFEAMGNARDSKTKRTKNFWKGREDHPAREEAHGFSLIKSADRARIAKKEQMESIADVGDELYQTECRALRAQDGTKEKEELMQRITELDAQWDKLNSSVPTVYRAVPANVIDDRICLRTPPRPRIQWDRRPFEPLTMFPEESWPPNRLALISSTPHPRPAGQTVDFYEWAHDFVYALLDLPSESLPEALDKMQHGLSQIIESCPSLTNPDKGGRLLMKHLRVRMLTGEMIDELVAAYRDWPFKEPGSDHNRYFRWKKAAKGKKSVV